MSDKRKKLGITCTSTDCENPAEPTHCFKPKRGQPGPPGTCRECGADLIDWQRVHERNLVDAANTFSALENETFRLHMMHVDVPEKVQRLALAKGIDTLRSRTERAVKSALRKPRSENAYDGRQTPRETSDSARIQHYAQHATATCCRQCLEYWHGIPADAELTDEQMQYCVDLAWEYISLRLGPFDAAR
ncbi:MAG: DUF4186 family protein [Acidimicrobiia bacterium]